MSHVQAMRRAKHSSRSGCNEILKAEPRGVLSCCGDEGYPYGIPWTTGTARTRQALFPPAPRGPSRRHPKLYKASICVYDQASGGREWALNIRSVVVLRPD